MTSPTMTLQDLMFHPAHNHHCLVHFQDGSTISGVYRAYFQQEPDQLYLVRSTDLIAFKPLMDAQDEVAMRPYCLKLDPSAVGSVERLI